MFEGQDFEPLDTEGRPLPAEKTPMALAAGGEPFVTGVLLASEDGGYRRYEATGEPLKKEGSQAAVASVVIRELG